MTTLSHFAGRTVAIEVVITIPNLVSRAGGAEKTFTVNVDVPIPQNSRAEDVEAILAKAANTAFSTRCHYRFNWRQRIRKAWSINMPALGLDGKLIVYAPEWREARNLASRILRDRGTEFRASQLRAVRSEAADQYLPEPHPIADEMSEEDKNILLHAYGLNEQEPEKAGYRDHYITTRHNPKMRNLERLGLMRPSAGPDDEGMVKACEFNLTPLGINVAMSLVPLYAKGIEQ